MKTSTKPYKPEGYASVSVYLMVAGAQEVIDFLRQALGGETLRRVNRPDGTVMHAEVKIDDTVVMLADTETSSPSHIHVYVPAVDVSYRRALAAGGVAVQEPAQQGDPDRRAGVRDPAGNTWWLSTQVGEG